MSGLFITFEGTEGCGKTTQIARLAAKLRSVGRTVKELREPGGTPIGEEIRHTLKHSHQNHAMTPEAELLLMSASRAQLVREVIRPALAAGEVVLCDRFFDSTIAYQGYGRGLDLKMIAAITSFAVGDARPNLTLFLDISNATSEIRLSARQAALGAVRDRFEEAGRAFFDRVSKGYEAIAAAEPARIKRINAAGTVDAVGEDIWNAVQGLL